MRDKPEGKPAQRNSCPILAGAAQTLQRARRARGRVGNVIRPWLPAGPAVIQLRNPRLCRLILGPRNIPKNGADRARPVAKALLEERVGLRRAVPELLLAMGLRARRLRASALEDQPSAQDGVAETACGRIRLPRIELQLSPTQLPCAVCRGSLCRAHPPRTALLLPSAQRRIAGAVRPESRCRAICPGPL